MSPHAPNKLHRRRCESVRHASPPFNVGVGGRVASFAYNVSRISTVFMSFALPVRSATARHCARRSLLLGRWAVGVDFLLLFNVICHQGDDKSAGALAYNYVKQILKFSKICKFLTKYASFVYTSSSNLLSFSTIRLARANLSPPDAYSSCQEFVSIGPFFIFATLPPRLTVRCVLSKICLLLHPFLSLALLALRVVRGLPVRKLLFAICFV